MNFLDTLSLAPSNVLAELPQNKASLDPVQHGRQLLSKALQAQLTLLARNDLKGPASWIHVRNGSYQLSVRIQRKLIEFAPGMKWLEFREVADVQAALRRLLECVDEGKFDCHFTSQQSTPEAQAV